MDELFTHYESPILCQLFNYEIMYGLLRLSAQINKKFHKNISGGSSHTHDDKPWKLITFIGFDCEIKAKSFERYLKFGSGHAFAQKRFW